MKFKCLLICFLCILFSTNKIHGQSFQINNDIQKLYEKIEALRGVGDYYEIIAVVNRNSNLISNAGTDWEKVINSYKYNCQYEIYNIAYKHYNEKDYAEAQNILIPIIDEIQDSIAQNRCNEACCIWSSCLWLYGKINQGQGRIDEALTLLNQYHEYVTNNLEYFLSYEDCNYTKYAYVVFWSDLANTYQEVGFYDESVKTFLSILDYCKKEYPDFIFDSIMNVGYAYNASYTSNGREMANVYFIEALDYLHDNSIIDENLDDYFNMLVMILSNYNLLNKYNKTIDVAKKYIKNWSYNIDDKLIDKLIYINNTRAQAYDKLDYSQPGSYELTEKIHKDILEYYETQGMTKTEKYAMQLRYYADSRQLKESQLATEYYKKAIDVWEEFSNKNEFKEYLTLVLRYINVLQKDSSKISEINKLQSLIDEIILTKGCNDLFLLINYYKTKSLYYKKQNMYSEADSLTTLALNICMENSHLSELKETKLELLTDKALILFLLNDWANGDKYCNEALSLMEEIENKNLIMASALETLALNYLNIGNMHKVYELERKALDIRLACNRFIDGEGNLNISLVVAGLKYSTLEERISMCEDVVKICTLEQRNLDYDLTRFIIVYAENLSELKQYEKADSLFQLIETNKKNINSTLADNSCSSLFANFYRSYSIHECNKGNLNNAAQLMKIANDLEPSYNKHQMLSTFYASLNNQNLYEVNIDEALNGIRTDIQYGFTFMDENERKIFITDGRVNSLNHYGEYAYLMPNSKIGMQKIYDSALLYKGMLLNTSREISNIISTSNNDSIKSIYADLQIAKRNNQTEDIKRKEKTILDYIKNNAVFWDLDITWKDVQNNLKSNECAVEFLRFKKNQWVWCNDSIDKSIHYIALVVTPNSESPIYVDLFDEEILEKAIEYGSNLYRNDYGRFLLDSIWKKINEVATNSNVVYFSPIGLLNLLNVESLSDDKSYIRLSSTREICKKESNEIQSAVLYGGLVYNNDDSNYVSTSKDIEDTIWYNLNDTITRGFYGYLPGTRMEVNHITKLLEKANVKTKCLTGEDGTVNSFRDISGNSPTILHIATHAMWNNESDNEDLNGGGLLFASSQEAEDTPINERENFISAKEISIMDLSKTSLAVLSACQTGIGKITDDGVWGIQRAFKMAGAKTIMMTLWKVDDVATALMMTTFYEKLLETENKYVAFKYAQKKVREKFENPYYWAGFIMLD